MEISDRLLLPCKLARQRFDLTASLEGEAIGMLPKQPLVDRRPGRTTTSMAAGLPPLRDRPALRPAGDLTPQNLGPYANTAFQISWPHLIPPGTPRSEQH